ncbi:hypothetical protein CPB84DRAFT_1814892 [Gymnopilus junonius]|uniref:DHHA2 domain-containing protein n=1 Tax=Gymnopilus junonius TaxID=109634 RepID=A0A9P5TPY1_GYMJU|nr:hypothetical protein CPB84DRAFT_1814892 [Gymnopilus junonius]
MPRNPLRRLSVALRLTEAYQPAVQAPPTPTTATSINLFLNSSKANFLKDVKEDPAKAAETWTVVMGNEAGDLDTIASSIAYSWILSEVHKKPAIPLIQVERPDLNLRAENLYALKLAGLSDTQEELLTLTEENPKAQVVAVVDHHADEGLYPDASPRTISPCGSCSSHVGALCPPEIPAELATLLLTAILTDTDGLKPGGKATQVDRDSALFLAPKSTIANRIPPPSALSPIDHPNPDALYEAQTIKDLTKTLEEKKSDVSHLNALDLLRRDYKEYSHKLGWATGQPTIKAGLSTVPSPLKAWATEGRLEKEGVEWMQRRGLTILGVLTSYHDAKKNVVGQKKKDKGKHKREMAWIILEEPVLAKTANDGLTSEGLGRRLWKGLEASKEIDVKVHKKISLKGGKLPGNSKARVTAPLLKDILENSASAPPTEASKTEEAKNEVPSAQDS